MSKAIELSINGMSCAGCVRSVEKALESVEGVIKASPDLMSNSASITSDGTVSNDALIKVLSDKGYKAAVVEPKPLANSQQPIELSISGMTCSGCVRSVEKALESVDGVIKASPDLMSNSASITSDGTVDNDALIKVLSDKGYKAEVVAPIPIANSQQVIDLSISGMTCAGCVRSVEKSILKVAGIQSASVDLITGTAKITLSDSSVISNEIKDDLIKSIGQSGYTAKVVNADTLSLMDEDNQAKDKTRSIFIMSVILTLPLVLQMALMPLGINLTIPPLFQFLLALPVQVIAGARFYSGIWNAVRFGQSNMDTLVAVGTTAAFGLSIAVMLGDTSEWLSWSSSVAHSLYFEASAAVITLVLLGKILEERAKGKTNEALFALMKLQPANALVERNGKQVTIPAEQVVKEDIVVIRPGDAVPVDGVVISGSSQLDEAMVTGESMPVVRQAGDFLIGGTINGEGLLRIKPTTLGQNSKLSQIINQVKSARTTKPRIQKLVDQVSAVFVPCVLVLALGTFLGWWLVGDASLSVAIINAVTVLVIACPCALGLATPTAIMVGSGQAARMGILIKDADVIDSLAKATTVVFDKTGTLTEGRPEVVNSVFSEKLTEQNILALTSGITKDSSHPLSKAIFSYLEEQSVTPEDILDIKAIPGLGVAGKIDQQTLFMGSQRLMSQEGFDIEAFRDFTIDSESNGSTQVWLGQKTGDGSTVLAVFALRDQIKSQSAEAVKALKKDGIKVVMLSGDQKSAAEKVAQTLGIDNVQANLLPDDKLTYLKKLHEQGEIVVMVGDGINDAPALAGADVGLAMGDGSDVAIKSADASLTQSNPYLVHKTIKTGRLIRQKIAQNLVGAFVYNVIGLPLAASGMLSPVMAGIAMALSSVTVMTSSLSLYSSLKRID